MLKAFRYRILPTTEQAELINKHIGSCRFVYNLALETKQVAYAGNKINLSCFDLHKQLPDLKKECIWLKEINSQSLQSSLRNLDTAYGKFFRRVFEKDDKGITRDWGKYQEEEIDRFYEEAKRLNDDISFLTYLMLHKIAHAKGIVENDQADKWAFERMSQTSAAQKVPELAR